MRVETLRVEPERRPDFFDLDSPQPIEKSRFGRIKPSKSKQFYLDQLGFAWIVFGRWVAGATLRRRGA